MNIGNSIRAIRKGRGFTAKHLAHRVGTVPKVISFIETGRTQPSRTMLEKICKELSVSLGFLMLYALEPSDFPSKACVKAAIEKLFRLL